MLCQLLPVERSPANLKNIGFFLSLSKTVDSMFLDVFNHFQVKLIQVFKKANVIQICLVSLFVLCMYCRDVSLSKSPQSLEDRAETVFPETDYESTIRSTFISGEWRG